MKEREIEGVTSSRWAGTSTSNVEVIEDPSNVN
jgi:hypothetical protein